MKIPPTYSITPEILQMITQIQAYRLFFTSVQIPQSLKQKLQRKSMLQSSLFSARIEGNTLNYEDLIRNSVESQKKKEIYNILEAYKYIEKNIHTNSEITKELLTTLYTMVLKGFKGERETLRTQVNAIFNQSGIPVYIPPPPTQLPSLLNSLLAYCNSDHEKFPLINAFISHLVFEKIHPFIDGNGRVGRLLIYSILQSKDENYAILVPFEEYLEDHREEYYSHLDQGIRETNNYLAFMIRAFLTQIEKTKLEIENELYKKNQIFLPPRQEEIFTIIREHRIVSFYIIHRRFLKVPTRTLRYDLLKLVKRELIIKVGNTKGSYYAIKE